MAAIVGNLAALACSQNELDFSLMQQPLRRISAQALLALVAILYPGLMSRAQDVTEPALKAAFIYNLAKFTYWPEEATSGPKVFSMCVVGDSGVGEALERSVKDRLMAGSNISVTRLSPSGSVRGCRVVYLSGVTKEQSAQILADLRTMPVLTISDLGGFNELGGMFQFFFERGQLRFSVGMDSVKKSGLQLSAKLLDLAVRK